MPQLHLSFGDDVQAVAKIAFIKEGLTAAQRRLTHLLLQRYLLGLIKSAEKRHLVDEVCVSIHKAGTPFCLQAPLASAADS